MSLSQPDAPDPWATAASQSMFNKDNAQFQQSLNQTGQVTPYGTLLYDNPGQVGAVATQTLNPTQQTLFNKYQKSQNQAGSAALNLIDNATGMYTSPPDFTSASSPLVKSQMQAFQDYMAPIFKQQESNLDSKLQNQGLAEGGKAWENAQRGQMTAEDQAAANALMQFEPQAYQQAVQTYNQPLQTFAGLFGAATPQGTQQPFVSTPQTQSQPPNYEGAVQNQYNAQMQQYGNTMQGVSNLGSAAVGGLFGLYSPFKRA